MTDKPTRDELRKSFFEWASSDDPGTSILATRIAPDPEPILLQQGYPDDDRDQWEENLHSETLHNNDMNRLKQAREAEEKKQRVEEVRRIKGEN